MLVPNNLCEAHLPTGGVSSFAFVPHNNASTPCLPGVPEERSLFHSITSLILKHCYLEDHGRHCLAFPEPACLPEGSQCVRQLATEGSPAELVPGWESGHAMEQ